MTSSIVRKTQSSKEKKPQYCWKSLTNQIQWNLLWWPPLLSNNLYIVTLFQCSLERSHKTSLTVCWIIYYEKNCDPFIVLMDKWYIKGVPQNKVHMWKNAIIHVDENMKVSWTKINHKIQNVSSTNKTCRHDITEILLKVALSTI